MALADTKKAIEAVSRALENRISFRTDNTNVLFGSPEEVAKIDTGKCFGLFLYEISYDPHLKNFAPDEGQKPPLWLVLKYLLTAFDGSNKSNSPEAHESLGWALRALHEADLLRIEDLPADLVPEGVISALESNPEELHVTFDEASTELLTKLMQGSEENLRLSIAFQVRPVMIASPEPSDYSLLVGVDYTQTPTSEISDAVGLDVIPSLGSLIAEIMPTGFQVGDEVTVKGTDLHLSDLSVRLGTVDLPVRMQRPDELRFRVEESLVNGETISAGSHPVLIIQTLLTEKKRRSNMVIGNLVPTLNSAEIEAGSLSVATDGEFIANIDFGGILLGNQTDDVVVAFYRDGRVIKMFDKFAASPPAQTTLRLEIEETDSVPEGEYLMILRVNGQQAVNSPKVTFAL